MPSKGAVYYTDCRLDEKYKWLVIRSIIGGLHKADSDGYVVGVILGTESGAWLENLRVASSHWLTEAIEAERGYLTMFKQILKGLQTQTSDIAYLTEHDVLYHPSHFEFTPPDPTKIYYNQNVWKVDAQTGHAIHYRCSQTSGLCANRKLLLDHYTKRVELVEKNGFTRKMGFEPGTHNRSERVDDLKHETWMSEFPNLDIRHTTNLTESRWSKDQFRNQRYTEGWTESDSVPGWGKTEGRFDSFLKDLE